MKKFIKKLLKWTGITLLVLILLIILIPIIFKDQIKQLVIDEVNKSLTAELSLRDFDLTFISTFPNVTIQLHDAKLTGLNEFEGVELMNIKNVEAHVGLWDVISGDQIEIDEVHIKDPVFDVRVLEDGMANYDIVKPDSVKTEEELSEPSSFVLSLQEYSISNARVKYDDRASNMYAEIVNLNHTGAGDLTAEVLDFETSTTMDELTYRMDGIDYLTEVKTDAAVNLKMEFTEKSSKFTLKDNTIKLNEVDFSVDGYYEMLEDHDDMDLTLDASKASFKDILSLIPTFYHSGYEGMVSSGDIKVNGLVKGKMDDTNLPAWDFGLKVINGSIKYPDLPGTIRNIQVDAGSTFEGGADLNKMTVDVNKFHANLSKNSIDATMALRNLELDPFINSAISAHVDLGTLGQFIPLADGESYSGKLDADVRLNGALSALDREDYEAFKAEGKATIRKMDYKSPDLPDEVKINKMQLTFAPENLTLNELDAKLGASDFKMAGAVDNYLAYALRGDKLVGDFTFNSNYLDLDHLMGIYPEEEGTAAETAAESPAETSEEVEPMLIPDNIDFKLASDIKKVKYNGITVKNITGDVRVNEEVASLENMQMKAMGGNIGLSGNYDTRNHATPKFDFAYNLQDIDIQELTKNFLTIEKLAPIAKYAKGKISSNFDMQTDLTPSLEPVMLSISSIGDLSSNKIMISGFDLLEKIENKTNLKDISKQTLKNFTTKFSIHDGKVMLTPFDISLGGIDTKVSGYTNLEKEMHYDFKMMVPKEKIPASITKQVENGLTLVNGLHPDIKVGDLPAFIPVDVIASGDPKNPKITTNFVEQVKSYAKQSIGNLIEDTKEIVKDSVMNIVNDQVDDIKEELEAQKQKILAEAKKQADQLRAEAKKAHTEAYKAADKGYEEAVKAAGSNPIKKKLAEAAAAKVRDKAYQKADDALAATNKKADDIEAKAKERADSLGN